jgi:hypothetical protein
MITTRPLAVLVAGLLWEVRPWLETAPSPLTISTFHLPALKVTGPLNLGLIPSSPPAPLPLKVKGCMYPSLVSLGTLSSLAPTLRYLPAWFPPRTNTLLQRV